MILPPILTASLPSPPGPHAVGYTFLTHPPFSPFFHPSPALKSTGKPAFRIEEIGYCLYYPTLSGGKEGKGWVNWVPEPFWGVIKGYERFLGGKGGMSWLVKPLGYIAGRLQVWLQILQYFLSIADYRSYRCLYILEHLSTQQINHIPSSSSLTASRAPVTPTASSVQLSLQRVMLCLL